jgi:hypothetical protein
MKAFFPIDRATTTISASTSSARGAIAKQPSGKHQVRLYNGTGQVAFYRLCDLNDDATTADIPLADGAIEVVTVENADALPVTHVAVILSTGSGSFYVTTGHGI